jgi:hypothetical protein
MFYIRKGSRPPLTLWLIGLTYIAVAGAVQAAPVAVSPEELVEGPAPISVRPNVAAPRQPRAREWLAERFAQVGSAQLQVVRGTVTRLTALERAFPEALYAEAHIGTTVEIAVAETYCGRHVGRLVATYVGGQLPDGRREFTSQMPKDLPIGQEYVFLLRQIGNELFIETGMLDIFRVERGGSIRMPLHDTLKPEDLRRLCP